jgi:hypothetical protein
MRVALVGSWKLDDKAEWNLTAGDNFPEACRQLGAAVARAGHVLIVGGQADRRAGYHAIEGVIGALGNARPTPPPIIILRPNDSQIYYEEWRTNYPRLFTSLPSPDSSWNITKLFQVKEADCLLVIGGAQNSFQAGLAAAVSGKPVVPIGSFGGAAKRLINLFATSWESWRSKLPTKDDLGQLHGPCTDFILEKAIDLLGLTNFPRLLIIHGRSEDKLKLKNYLQNILNLPEPVIMAERSTPGEPLPVKFESLAQSVHGAIALVTPDDVGGVAELTGDVSQLERRARQNVWLEVGWFWGHFGRDRFLLLCREKTVIPSDLQGMEYMEYQTNPVERGDAMRVFIRHLQGGERH